MTKFSNDTDILRYEPELFGELHLPWQVLASGSGAVLSGATFTASGADFVSASVEAGGVIYLRSVDGLLDMAAEIVSVDSATQLTVSVLRADSDEAVVAPPAATDISYRVSTLGPQINEIGFQLTEYFGISPGNPSSDIGVDDIFDTEVLRRASTFGSIAAVYAMLASQAEDENFWKKSLYYKKNFERSRERCQLSIDVGSDGVADIRKFGGSVKLVRD